MGFLKSVLGAVTGGILGHNSAKQAHTYNVSEAETNEQLQEQLFKYENENKHQFEVGDLRAAGLNPILSATNSSVASVGGVSNGSNSSADVAGGAEKIFSAISRAEVDRQNAETNRNNAEAEWFRAKVEEKKANTSKELSDSQIKLNEAEGKLKVKEIDRLDSQIENDKKITSAQVDKLKADAMASGSIAVLNHTRSLLESKLADSQIQSDSWTREKIKHEITNLKKEAQLLQGEIDDPEEKARRDFWSSNGTFHYGAREYIRAGSGMVDIANSAKRLMRK